MGVKAVLATAFAVSLLPVPQLHFSILHVAYFLCQFCKLVSLSGLMCQRLASNWEVCLQCSPRHLMVEKYIEKIITPCCYRIVVSTIALHTHLRLYEPTNKFCLVLAPFTSRSCYSLMNWCPRYSITPTSFTLCSLGSLADYNGIGLRTLTWWKCMVG